MNARRTFAAVTVTALGLLGLHAPAGADSTFTVSDSSITAGGSVTVTLTEACTDAEGQPDHGSVVVTSGGSQIASRSTFGDSFSGSATFTFDDPGTFTISRYCDYFGFCSAVNVTVSAPATTTTEAPTTTTSTTVPGSVAPSTTVAPTTTIAAVVESVSTPEAVGATPVTPKKVTYAG